ncbi:MAG: GNAT family N-acetyltransferase [Gammaproteobacteria bacterium]
MTDLREAQPDDRASIVHIHELAFGDPTITQLVNDMLGDASTEPMLSLLASAGGEDAGHVFFSHVRIESADQADSVGASILAPLAVVPDKQGQGIGGSLIRRGLELLANRGVRLVFVLGYPAYYGRFGFKPAGVQGFQATYPIPEANAEAWMMLDLDPDGGELAGGRVVCADSLNKEEYWVE